MCIRDSLNSVVIKIQNNGPKIEDEIIDKIFDVGFTTKENSNNCLLYTSRDI